MSKHTAKAGCLAAALTLSATGALAQSGPEGAHMVLDTADKACLQLKDANTWTTSVAQLNGVGTVTSMATLLTQLNTDHVKLTDDTHPPVVGYLAGLRWSDADMATRAWVPQGLAMGVSGSNNFAIVSWHWQTDGYDYDNGSRITVSNVTTLADAKYRSIMLVKPTGNGTYEPVKIHVGGLAIAGSYLYVADTSNGMRVFDLNNFRDIDGDSELCKKASGEGIFGKVVTNGVTRWCANGYGYMLPQVNAYTVPSAKSDGTLISAACKPKFSYLGKDTRGTTSQIMSGEYCTDDTLCEGKAGGLNGRLYQWPVGGDGKLIATNLYVNPTKVYWMNVRNIQGVAPDMVPGAAADSYWLSSTRNGGTLYKVTPTATAKSWRYDNALAPFHPEGVHATVSSGHLWIATEGLSDPNAEDTNPATRGKTLIYIDQNKIN